MRSRYDHRSRLLATCTNYKEPDPSALVSGNVVMAVLANALVLDLSLVRARGAPALSAQLLGLVLQVALKHVYGESVVLHLRQAGNGDDAHNAHFPDRYGKRATVGGVALHR